METREDTKPKNDFGLMDTSILTETGGEWKVLLVLMVMVIGIEFLYFNYHKREDIHKALDERIEYNLENIELIQSTIIKELQGRINLLKTKSASEGRLNYNQWIEYNNKSPYVVVDSENDRKYWIQTWRLVPQTDGKKFILKSYPDASYINHSWKDIIYINQRKFTSNHVETDEELLFKMYLSDEKPFTLTQYYWYDPVFKKMVERRDISMRYDDEEGNSGFISSGYTIKNINKGFTFDHLTHPLTSKLYYGSNILTMLLAFMIYYYNHRDHPRLGLLKSSIFFIILSGYTAYYCSIDDEMGSVDVEIRKLDSINQGTISISFLTGLSIFVLSAVKKNHPFLYKETSFLLVFFILTVIFVLFKNNSYVLLQDITEHRVFKEFIFNYCILMYMFIMINFGINVLVYDD